jgi:glycosyltransferase 2 family protein
MLEMLRASARFISEKIGWHRIGFAVSVMIIATAAVVLYRMLRTIEFHEVLQALKSTEPRDVVLAGLCVAAGYFTLTFYDLFAVRTIGRNDISYWTAALAGFTSYSIGHNIGASAVTGGAVRYRVYSAHGVSVIEVAKICFVAGLTFWLGNAAVLGMGIFYAPEAASLIDQLPPWFNRILGAAVIIALIGYVGWVGMRPRVIGRSDWQVTLPGGKLTLLQIAIGIVDLGFCAAAMFLLLPDEPHIGFITVSVIFVSATLLGFASHSPGGLGVFDAAMLVALWQFDREDLLAGLLLFRLLYYIIPFAIALAILGSREILKSVFTARVPSLTTMTGDALVARSEGDKAAPALSGNPDPKPSSIDGPNQ